MKKYIISILALLLCVPATFAQTDSRNRVASTIIADGLAQLPAGNPQVFSQVISEMAATGEQGIQQLASSLNSYGKGEKNSVFEYALSGITDYASSNAGASCREGVKKGLAQAVKTCKNTYYKNFLLSLFGRLASAGDFDTLAGYTGDKVIETLRENGADAAIISLGGNVQAFGEKPDGSAWKVAVRDPFTPDNDMCTIEIGEKAVITSGNYERCFTGDDGKVYWHIIDPADGFPADNGIVSATIIGDEGLTCDALSTAMFVEGLEGACELWKNDRSYDMILVTDDSRIFYTEGIADSFTNLTSMPAEVIPVD